MKRKLLVVLAVLFVAAVATIPVSARRGDGPVIYVTSQGKYYDAVIAADSLPAKGPFQKLEEGGPHGGLQTEFGPGDHGYVGGRWWVDVNGDGEMDAGDGYFSCPLLGPGRESP
jgi:hypothetical protein